ncbi:Cro/C1-type HTH DNA-binding domain-containing protein [Pedobacter terrae]|uniref:Cro/C1-type HTH DNA-binding domain-containing protein n=1 Tax=Pedobacter terrae TaxID=405671 RepID=A0A1G7XG74_9SPHI|nr:helix-turn-helix transcriptional regulator [Pedobacter terrae]SDG83248.1 Cro/C1-type HTH DNA-binding domain-containing protein [Pedobacter terrae]
MRIINRLAEVFKEKDVYNRDIAKHLNKSEETVSRWVNNHRQPSLNDLDDIANYLKVDIRDLLYPSDWSHNKVEGLKNSKQYRNG